MEKQYCEFFDVDPVFQASEPLSFPGNIVIDTDNEGIEEISMKMKKYIELCGIKGMRLQYDRSW